jgi:hypothetical protein
MGEEMNKQILDELRKMNEKLDVLTEKQQGLSTPMKVMSLILGFIVIGPLLSFIVFFFMGLF